MSKLNYFFLIAKNLRVEILDVYKYDDIPTTIWTPIVQIWTKYFKGKHFLSGQTRIIQVIEAVNLVFDTFGDAQA